ncbi:flagellar protein FliT [Pseudomonas sp. nanlin1]|uniref:flagellar protein FliT n=1 Tax=Pseudomonas sp. nanlin1 TaxID=3040605 RepID=UPI00388D3CF0
MSALQKIEQTRDALVDALVKGDWQAIGVLDVECRACVDSVLSGPAENPAELSSNLESLLGVYRLLLEKSTGARQAIVDEMAQINQAKNAAKVYHLFR